MLQVESLSKRYGDRTLFEGLTFGLERGDKIGLIAPNGSGKTTLMNILVGLEPCDSGRISYERDLRWAYLEQQPHLPQGASTVLEACFNRFDPVAQLVLRWKAAVAAGDEQQMAMLLPQMETQGGWDYEQRAKEILGALGIQDQERSVVGLSGGEAKRVALAATLISRPDLLYLDEPTNHLDLKSIEWLESYLMRSTMSLVLITHDRYILDRVCNQVLEISRGRLYRYLGNYDYYLSKREERENAEAANLARMNNLYRRELEWIRRQPQARGGKARYRVNSFQELEAQLSQRRGEQALRLGLDRSYIGKKIFEATGVGKSYGDKIILKNFNYIFTRYDKIGIVGENGVGKTTFLKMLLGLEPTDEGTIDVGSTVRFGYYSQQAPSFAPAKRVIDVVQDIADTFVRPGSGGERISASQLLTQFLFAPERQYTEVEKLSGGELRRLYLCTVLVTQPNFLILDEPTNDLDLLTLQALEEYLIAFSGCVIVVSHDRFFMDKIVDHLLCFEGDGIVRDFPGNYSLYRAWMEGQGGASKPIVKSKPEGKSETPSVENHPARLSYAEKRELEQITERLPKLEQERSQLEQEMSTGNMTRDQLLVASQRIGVIMEETDALVWRQLELEDKIG